MAEISRGPESPQTDSIYTVKPGDTFSQIAKDKGMSIVKLRELNPQIKNLNKIKIGEQLNVPEKTKVPTNQEAVTSVAEGQAKAGRIAADTKPSKNEAEAVLDRWPYDGTSNTPNETSNKGGKDLDYVGAVKLWNSLEKLAGVNAERGRMDQVHLFQVLGEKLSSNELNTNQKQELFVGLQKIMNEKGNRYAGLEGGTKESAKRLLEMKIPESGITGNIPKQYESYYTNFISHKSPEGVNIRQLQTLLDPRFVPDQEGLQKDQKFQNALKQYIAQSPVQLGGNLGGNEAPRLNNPRDISILDITHRGASIQYKTPESDTAFAFHIESDKGYTSLA